MSEAGTRLKLEDFLTRVAPGIDSDVGARIKRVHGIATHLSAHLGAHPDLAAQVSKLRETLPETLGAAPEAERSRATAEARLIAADIKSRWIEAEDAPLVDEIDDHLEEIDKALDQIRRPGIDGLRAAAARIDLLGRRVQGLDGIEQRYLVPAAIAGVLFVIGLVLLFLPGQGVAMPVLSGGWGLVACLGALPAVILHYAFRVLPRSRADAEAEDLNREHFLPNGGLYFPEGDRPACVVLVNWPPERTEGQIAREERRQRKEKLGPW